MKNKKIVIAGGTGFIGQALVAHFGKQNQLVVFSRQGINGHNNACHHQLLLPADGYDVTYRRWDGRHLEKHWTEALENADIVINLAGKSVNCRYTQKNKQLVTESRVHATTAIGNAIRQCTQPPKLWVNAASATIYQHSLEEPNDEYTGRISHLKKDNMPFSFLDRLRFACKKIIARLRFGKNHAAYTMLDEDFSVAVCKAWENAFDAERTPFTRKVALRTAITLGQGGVMVPYCNLVKWGLGGSQGNGQQKISWLHIQDFCNCIEWIYQNKEAEGIYNLAAPNAVTNSKFMQTLRSITKNSIGLPAFTSMLEAGAAIIGTETELILKSRWVLPTRLQKEGFRFQYNTLHDALTQIIQASPRKQYYLF